jgi:tetratricopeptide (TPR) repeat protein
MMDAQIRRRRTLEAVKRIIIRESLKQPLVVIFEDLHWIDAESQDFMDLLVDSVASARILMLANYRPEYRHGWGNRTYYTQLRLDPLGSQSAEEMLHALLGSDASLQSLRRLIVEKTRGNPFFMEEIVQTLVEQGALVRNGATRLTKPLTEIRIPPTVHGILASRIDALPAPEKSLLQILAVIGKDFPLNLVKHVTASPDERLEPVLKGLQAGEFIYEQPALGEAVYTFKHALTQEVAYNSVLLERRRRLHLKVAEALEALHGERLSGHYNELIHHNTRAGDAAKTLHYLRLATEQGNALGAYEQVLAYENAALRLLETLKEGTERSEAEIFWLHLLGWTLGALRGWQSEDTAGTFRRLAGVSRQTGNSRELMRALSALKLYHLNRDEMHKALAVAEEHLAIASRAGDSVQQASAHAGLADVLVNMGEFAAARENFEKAISLLSTVILNGNRSGYTPMQLRGLQVYSAHRAPEALWFLGFPDQARRRSEETLVLAEKAEPLLLAHALAFTSYMHVNCRELKAVRQRVDQLSALVNRYGLNPHYLEHANELQGRAAILEGQYTEAVRVLGDTPRAKVFVALAYAAAGKAARALETADEALADLYASECRAYESTAHQTRGEVLLVQAEPRLEEAERCFRTAIEVARRQSAKSLELHAVMSLARLLAKQGRRAEARTMLAEIYGWFTEGFDTADLKDAKALLDELSR